MKPVCPNMSWSSRGPGPYGIAATATENSEPRMWTRTEDGSVVDDTGKVIYFSLERFVRDIGLGDCCFICGASPSDVPFNNEHVIPEWILRRFGLFDRSLTLPNGTSMRYDRYTVPCCVACNGLMGRVIEQPTSALTGGGPSSCPS